MPISIDFLANEHDLVRGADKSADALEKISDALDDVARDSQRSAGKMESEYQDAARGVDQSNERLERSFRELAQASKQETGKLGDDLARSTRSGTEAAGHSVAEFGDEAKQNIAETFSSFRGDATDFAQIVQDTLGGLAGSLEGIPGVAAVAAGAAGLGLVLGALETGQAESEAWKQSVSELAQSLIDTGNDGAPAVDRIVAALKTLATTTGDTNLAKLSQLAETAGADFKKLGQTWGGNSADLRSLWRELDKNNDAIWTSIRAAQQRGDANLEEKYRGEARAALELRNEVGKQIGVTAAAEAQFKAYAEAGGPELEAKATAVQNLAQSYQDAAGDVEDYTNAETGAFDTDAYVAAFQKKAQALADFATNMQQAATGLSPAALSFLEQQGTDAAATLVSAYVNGTAAQKQQLNQVWTQAGSTSSSSYASAFQAGIPAQVAGPDIVARWKVDDSALQAAIRSQVNVTVPVKLVDPRSGKAVW